jgi:hypothetical protein
MDPLPVALKIQVEVELGGRPLKISAQVEGEGEAARHAAAELAAAIASITAAAANAPALTPANAQAAEQLAIPAALIAPPIASSKGAAPPSPLGLWIGRNRARINVGVGGVLLTLAVFIPIVVPPAQRSDVLIMTILFGITGALLLATAMLPARNTSLKTNQVAASATPKPATARPMPARSSLPEKPTPTHPVKAAWGIGLGTLFVLAGFIAPFVLGATSADERFIIMLGFAPVVVVGFFMLVIFARGLFKFSPPGADASESVVKPVTSGGAATAKRAPVSRVPQNLEYKAFVPAAIIGLLIVMVAVVALVIFATVSSAVR